MRLKRTALPSAQLPELAHSAPPTGLSVLCCSLGEVQDLFSQVLQRVEGRGSSFVPMTSEPLPQAMMGKGVEGISILPMPPYGR